MALDGDQRGAAVAFDAALEVARLFVVGLRAGNLVAHQLTERLSASQRSQVIDRDAGGGKLVGREVGSPEGRVFTKVAQNIGELKRYAAIHCQALGVGTALKAPDIDARQAHGSRDAIAIFVKLLEVFKGRRLQVLSLARDDIVENVSR